MGISSFIPRSRMTFFSMIPSSLMTWPVGVAAGNKPHKEYHHDRYAYQTSFHHVPLHRNGLHFVVVDIPVVVPVKCKAEILIATGIKRLVTPYEILPLVAPLPG